MKLPVPCMSGGDLSFYGGVSVEMIFQYYNVKYSHQFIHDMLQETQGGTDMPQMGRIFLRYGFDVTFVSQHPNLFSVEDAALTNDVLMRKIESRIEFASGRQHDRITIKNLHTFLSEGGKVDVRVPTIELVKNELDQKYPVMAFFATTFNIGGRSNKSCHPGVIVGYRGPYIFINDPAVGGRHKKIRTKWFFGGIYASQHGMIDDGSLLLIRPKKK